ncbi:MAG: rRNA maturation RNase YbeY [Candidatus Eisenbacteria bacterium]|nr:rRNA maturation RNase YbeY [Candidatus Latescibacterota bacterium]MBD3301729.1 rRNA maturation RNase YbeY [Candidatus Eisenbacteria bacterium]
MESETHRFEIANRQRRARLRRNEIRALLRRILEGEGEPGGVSVVFVGPRTMTTLNRRWRGEDRPTDVLSFPAGPSPPGLDFAGTPLGEIVVCVPVCGESAARRGVPLHAEIARMLIHGTLHLLGHDHGSPEERRRMQPRERRYREWVRRSGLQVSEP